jgi:hypothetical protein
LGEATAPDTAPKCDTFWNTNLDGNHLTILDNVQIRKGRATLGIAMLEGNTARFLQKPVKG